MERKVGEIFEYNGEWYQCIHTKSLGCENCDLATKSNIHCSDVFEIRGECLSCYRKDGKSVIFKKLEKVGEPIRIENKSYQKIKVSDALCNNCAFYDNFSRDCKLNGHINHYPTYSCLINEMFVEIKQNKENMEEREYSEEDMKNNPRFKHHKNIEQVINMQKMKPFDLEAAKAGKPVCTRDGRKARIICFDTINKGNYPIIALLEDKGSEAIFYYNKDGKCNVGTELDLMMLPEKKEGWVNVYKSYNVGKKTPCIASIYPTKEEAKKSSVVGLDYVDTVKIEWEE
ncbi:hypothetical protein [Barnesiella intestinihominis]|uniref:hypothetical protein n=1 Tax=Barnesiella intestinihominis TaxID=487174 RepID=UPI0039672139